MIRKLSYKKVQFKVDIPIYIGNDKFTDLPTKQILQKSLKTNNLYKTGLVPYNVDLYITTAKSRHYLMKLISQKYNIKLKYISSVVNGEYIDGILYRRIVRINIHMPLDYKREWRLRQLLDKPKSKLTI